MNGRRKVRIRPSAPPTGWEFWFPKSVGWLFLAAYCTGFAAEIFMIRTGFYQIATRKAAERRLQRTKDRDAAFEKAPMEMKVRFVQMEESLKRQLET